MNFYKRRLPDEPEINFIPLIDVLLVIIIFLMLTTTYARFSGLEITLPSANAEAQDDPKANHIEVAITATGQVMIDQKTLASTDASALIDGLMQAAKNKTEPTIVIHADAKATHQSVVDVMQAAREAGLPKISFETQSVKP